MTTVRRDGQESYISKWLRNNPVLDSQANCQSFTDQDFWNIGFKPPVAGKRIKGLKLMLCIEFKTHGKDPEFSQREILWMNHQAALRSPVTRAYCKKCLKMTCMAVIKKQIHKLVCQHCKAVGCLEIRADKGVYYDIADGRGQLVTMWNFGCVVAKFPGEGPFETWSDVSGGDYNLEWGTFDRFGNLAYTKIPVYTFEDILAWKKLPYPPFEDLKPATRAHHHFEVCKLEVKTPFGFEVREETIWIS